MSRLQDSMSATAPMGKNYILCAETFHVVIKIQPFAGLMFVGLSEKPKQVYCLS